MTAKENPMSDEHTGRAMTAAAERKGTGNE